MFSRAGSLIHSRGSTCVSVRPETRDNERFQLHPAERQDGEAGKATASSSSSAAPRTWAEVDAVRLGVNPEELGGDATVGADAKPTEEAAGAEGGDDEGAERPDRGAEDESLEVPERKCLPHPGDPSKKEIEEHEAEGHVRYRSWCTSCVQARGFMEEHRLSLIHI